MKSVPYDSESKLWMSRPWMSTCHEIGAIRFRKQVVDESAVDVNARPTALWDNRAHESDHGHISPSFSRRFGFSRTFTGANAGQPAAAACVHAAGSAIAARRKVGRRAGAVSQDSGGLAEFPSGPHRGGECARPPRGRRGGAPGVLPRGPNNGARPRTHTRGNGPRR